MILIDQCSAEGEEPIMRTTRGVRIAVVAAAAAALMGVGGTAHAHPAGIAAATEKESPPEAEETDLDVYCTANLTTSKTACFDTDAEAERSAPDWVLKVWAKPNYKGKSFRIFHEDGGCEKGDPAVYHWMTADLRNQDPAIGLPNWNNRASSLKTRHGCRAKLFAKQNWTGNETKWLGDTPRLGRVPGGDWNNAATSIALK